MNRVINEHIQSNWDLIRSDLSVDSRCDVTLDMGRLIGEGFYNLGQTGIGPWNAVYSQTSYMTITVRLIPGDPPSFYIVRAFPAGRGF